MTRPDEKPVFSALDHVISIVPTSSWRLERGSLMMLSKPETFPSTTGLWLPLRTERGVRQEQQEGLGQTFSSISLLSMHRSTCPSFQNHDPNDISLHVLSLGN